MAEKILTTKIKLPELVIEKKRVGGNWIVQLAQHEEIVEVDVFKDQGTTFLLKDQVRRKFFLKMPNSRVKIGNGNILKAKKISTVEDLDENIKLFWEHNLFEKATKDPKEIVKSWNNNFYFREEKEESYGLRRPQLGAIHAISSHWSVKNSCATLVMPTGTGKTETMISVLLYKQCGKVLVVVPSKVLRRQMFKKFLTLGCLRSIGAIDKDTLNPRVSLIEHGIKSTDVLVNLVDESNVIIATSHALNNFSNEVKEKLAKKCTHLFIDEAHHVPAKTWDSIKNLFKNKLILQFTATPFRRDNKRIDGDIIYNYPLGMAQDDKYFKKINLTKIHEFDDSKSDEEIAKKAISDLKRDLNNNVDHILMARCKNKHRADKIYEIYRKHGKDYNPILVHSGFNNRENKEAIKKLEKRETRVVVCVDMLGEGYDLPNLKIAALHDAHKSLAITLQFIGRFTRSAHNVGDATVVINISDSKVNKEIEMLYAEDADWNKLLKQKSESTIQREIDFHEFINSFTGELSQHISLWNLRPAFTTLVYETKCENWTPQTFSKVIPEKYKYWYAINDAEKILVVVVGREYEVSWGKYKDIKNRNFELCVVHWSKKHDALFLHCSDYNTISCEKFAKEVCGDNAEVKNGPKVFNIFSGVERVLARSLGVSTIGKISYTMHFDDDITEGLSNLDKSTSVLNNIFGWGFENGERVAEGCAAKTGKVWARGGGPITVWKEWCHKIADKIFDEGIEENKIIRDFLRPRELKRRYESVPLLVQWSENILKVEEEKISLFWGEKEYKVYEVDLAIIERNEKESIFFKVFSDKEESKYKIEFEESQCTYSLVEGEPVKIKKYSGDKIALVDYVKNDPITIIYIDGSFSYNNFHVPTPQLNGFFSQDRLNVIDWNGVDIQVESLGKDNRTNSIQHKIAQTFKEDYEIIFNDDAPGEAADILAIRQESNDSFKLHLIHCKSSSDSQPGSRITDFYALCGQAQKCIRWKHSSMEYLVKHMKKREEAWQESNKTRFIKGNMSDLNRLKKFSRFATNFLFEVSIVQPGLSKARISDDIIQLLGSTEDYLLKTSGANFSVYCSA